VAGLGGDALELGLSFLGVRSVRNAGMGPGVSGRETVGYNIC